MHVICNADIIAPFIEPYSASSTSSAVELIPGASIDILLEHSSSSSSVATPTDGDDGTWWNCSFQHLIDLSDVDSAISVLTQSSNDWELGWSKSLTPPPLVRIHPDGSITNTNQSDVVTIQNFSGSSQRSSAFHSNGRRRSGGLMALLRVERPTVEIELDRQQQRKARPDSATTSITVNNASALPPTIWPSNYPSITPLTFPSFPVHSWLPASTIPSRGTSVSVFSSPYGLLSTHIFHNTLTRGVVSNVVRLDTRERTSSSSSGDALTYPRTSFFGRRSQSTERTSPTALTHVPPTLLLIDARCFSGSEGAPVLTSSQHDAKLVGMMTLPIRHTARGSAVELNLAIPTYIIQQHLDANGFKVWMPSNDTNRHPSPSPDSSRSHPHLRGEGWKILQSTRRPLTAAGAAATPSNNHLSLPHLESSSHPRSMLSSPPFPTATAQPTRAKSSQSRHGRPSSRSPTVTSFINSHAAAIAPTPSPLVDPSTSDDVIRSVDEASKSVLMARIGGSWASAIVLTADGCQEEQLDTRVAQHCRHQPIVLT